MILHLVHDEKIINRTVEVFNTVFPNENLFVVFTSKDFKFVNKTERVITVEEFQHNFQHIEFSSVVIHYLSSAKIKFVNKLINPSIPVYWIVWGAELYNDLLAFYGFNLFYTQSSYFNTLKTSTFRKIKTYLKKRKKAHSFRRFISTRVNYVVSDIEGDFEMLHKYLPEMKSKVRKDFIYYPVDTILGENLIGQWIKGENIQIGNSASLSNNHEYVMNFLKNLNTGKRCIYAPLSYAGNAKNTSCVINTGNKHFGQYFKPMTEFMSLNDYTNLMTSFNVVLYGNWRQEAIGNILISIYLGAKVFLPKCNPIISWAKKRNIVLFELEKITQKDIDTPLSDEIKIRNREIILDLYNIKRMQSLILELGLKP